MDTSSNNPEANKHIMSSSRYTKSLVPAKYLFLSVGRGVVKEPKVFFTISLKFGGMGSAGTGLWFPFVYLIWSLSGGLAHVTSISTPSMSAPFSRSNASLNIKN